MEAYVAAGAIYFMNRELISMAADIRWKFTRRR
jgi:hypothetical protein